MSGKGKSMGKAKSGPEANNENCSGDDEDRNVVGEFTHLKNRLEEVKDCRTRLNALLMASGDRLTRYEDEVKQLRLKLSKSEQMNWNCNLILTQYEGDVSRLKKELAERDHKLAELDGLKLELAEKDHKLAELDGLKLELAESRKRARNDHIKIASRVMPPVTVVMPPVGAAQQQDG